MLLFTAQILSGSAERLLRWGDIFYFRRQPIISGCYDEKVIKSVNRN